MAPGQSPVRVRFAPSPTGELHIGGLRSALFNWLFARHHGGSFLLRIEDTDIERSKAEYTDNICRALRWCNLDIDEPIIYQSERSHIYQQYLDQLLAHGYAYWSPAEEEAYGTSVVRFRVPRDRDAITFYDHVRGSVRVPCDEIDDFPLARSDGSPLYNFVVVVDDIAMRISHIIRGEDHISNTPRQLLLYEAFGASLPHFAHVPLILGPSGQRLSKRDAATSTLSYRDHGFLPDALCNYMVRLGWSHYDQEIFTRDELIQYFTLNGINVSAAIFDYDKLRWMNSEYIRSVHASDLRQYIGCHLDHHWRDQLVSWINEQVDAAIALYQPRVATVCELQEAVDRLHQRPVYHQRPDNIPWSDETPVYLRTVADHIEQLEPYTPDQIKQCVKRICSEYNIRLPVVAKPIRFALTGLTESPSVFDIMHVLGPQETAYRCRSAAHM